MYIKKIGFWLVSNFELDRKFDASKSPTFHTPYVSKILKTNRYEKN
ncbi:MAG: hypothetical protein ACI884_002241, partial [Ulvibacter sp.]